MSWSCVAIFITDEHNSYGAWNSWVPTACNCTLIVTFLVVVLLCAWHTVLNQVIVCGFALIPSNFLKGMRCLSLQYLFMVFSKTVFSMNGNNVLHSKRHLWELSIKEILSHLKGACVRSRYQRQGQVIASHPTDTVGCNYLSSQKNPYGQDGALAVIFMFKFRHVAFVVIVMHEKSSLSCLDFDYLPV